ncbi:hypothetical protein CYMTET_8111 [Cymbomonas tetramitiformis]|uniref:Uncharacterized protein n=1 Tax=Cymbomonas tetramitiformis TaxID=36881 RepID=A0AAE0LGT4_9CHLO|nr:hypothetical protein CYMTET_8111 [Cymbomonas tetramitiformis]
MVYGKGVWKGERQPVLDHLKEVWAAARDVRMISWASMFSKMHDWGKELYTDSQTNHGFSLVYSRRHMRNVLATLLDFDVKFEEIFKEEILSIDAACVAAVENGDIERMAAATVKALAEVQSKGKSSTSNTVEDNTAEEEEEDTLDSSMCEDIAVDTTEDAPVQVVQPETMEDWREYEHADPEEELEPDVGRGEAREDTEGVQEDPTTATQGGEAQQDAEGVQVNPAATLQGGEALQDAQGMKVDPAMSLQGGEARQDAGGMQVDPTMAAQGGESQQGAEGMHVDSAVATQGSKAQPDAKGAPMDPATTLQGGEAEQDVEGMQVDLAAAAPGGEAQQDAEGMKVNPAAALQGGEAQHDAHVAQVDPATALQGGEAEQDVEGMQVDPAEVAPGGEAEQDVEGIQVDPDAAAPGGEAEQDAEGMQMDPAEVAPGGEAEQDVEGMQVDPAEAAPGGEVEQDAEGMQVDPAEAQQDAQVDTAEAQQDAQVDTAEAQHGAQGVHMDPTTALQGGEEQLVTPSSKSKMKGLLQQALASSKPLTAMELSHLLCEDFRRGVRAFHAYMKERTETAHETMPMRLFSYFDPLDGVLFFLLDYQRFGFHEAIDKCGRELCLRGCAVCRFLWEKGVESPVPMSRQDYLLAGGFALGFWDHPKHAADIAAIVKDPSSVKVVEYVGLPMGIAYLGPTLMEFYDTYLSMATRNSMYTERKGGEAGRVGVTGNVTSLRAFALLNEQSGTLTEEMRAAIVRAQKAAKQRAPPKRCKDNDQHVSEFKRFQAMNEDAREEDARVAEMMEEGRRLQQAEKEERQAKAAAERAERARLKEIEQLAATRKREERDAKKLAAESARHARNALNARYVTNCIYSLVVVNSDERRAIKCLECNFAY